MRSFLAGFVDARSVGNLASYLVGAASGLVNTMQQLVNEVVTMALLPQKHYQKVRGLFSFFVFVGHWHMPYVSKRRVHTESEKMWSKGAASIIAAPF